MALVAPVTPLIRRLTARFTGGSKSTGDDAGADAGAAAPLLRVQATGSEGDPETRASPQPWLRQYTLLLVPTTFDLVATILQSVGLLWVTASVYQMMRGSEIVFAALFSTLFLRRTLNGWHGSGITLSVLGEGLITLLLVLLLLRLRPVVAALVGCMHALVYSPAVLGEEVC